MTARIVYRGFDKLKVTLHARVSEALLRALAAGREKAETDGTHGGGIPWDVPGLAERVEMYPHGLKGGYTFGFKTGGYEGIQLFAKREPRPADGNVLIQPAAAGLVSHGYTGTRDRILDLVERLGIGIVALKLNRIDFAVDVHAEPFALSPDHLIVPPSVRRRNSVTAPKEPETDTGDVHSEHSGRRVTGLRVGGRTGRQFAIYDKAAEIRRHRLDHYQVVWDMPDPQPGEVWRFEARFGPDELRKKWGIHGFADLEASFGDALGEFWEDFRLTLPNPRDSNPARWPDHPVFALVKAEAKRVFSGWRSGLVRGQPGEMAFERVMHDAAGRAVSGLAKLGIGAGRTETDVFRDIAAANIPPEYRPPDERIKAQVERIARDMQATFGRE